MSQATLTTKGQVTIPKAVREQLDLKAGDRIDFIVNDSGAALIRLVFELDPSGDPQPAAV